MAVDRRHARILTMQALCQWDAQRDESPDHLRDFLTTHAGVEGGVGYAARLVEAFWLRREDVDRRIESSTAKWKLSRISLVERNIMRVAVVEVLGGEVPPKVAINEAVEIGKEYGGAETPRFINGVLDAILHDLARTTKDQG